jgi:hypothetical protein
MMRNFGVVASVLLTLGFVGYACTSGEVVDGPATGSGNATGTGTGNTTGQAGTSGTGNTTGKGGTTGTGNTTGKGGTTGTGNVTGQAGRGGTTGTGNTTGTAGTVGTGNTTGTAGVSGSAGSTGSCPSSFSVSAGGFVQMPVSGGGCWQGYAFTFTETPNCGSTITPKDFAACGTNSYCAVVGMGFSINQVGGASPTNLAPKGQGIKVTFSETAGTLPFRVQLRDDSTSTGYCFTATTSPVMIPYGSFNTKCYDTPADGVAYSMTPFTSVQILIAGGAAASTFTMALTKVEEY